MTKETKKEITLKEQIFNLLKTHKKSGEGFGDCIGSFWDDKSIMDLAEILAGKIEEE